MNSFLGVLLFGIIMSVISPLFINWLGKISSEEDSLGDSEEYVLRPKKNASLVEGNLWNAVWGGWVFMVYKWIESNAYDKILIKKSIPVLIIIPICFWSVVFYVILSTIPGQNETRVSSNMIIIKRFWFVKQITFDDIRSYRYLDRGMTWIVYTNKRPKRIWFDKETTNADLFVNDLEKHGIKRV